MYISKCFDPKKQKRRKIITNRKCSQKCEQFSYREESNKNIFFMKDAHRFKDSIACPETSVRVCFWGVNSRFTFQNFESVSACLVYFV